MGPERIAKTKKAADAFFCKFLNREVRITECIDDYVNANSLNIRHSPCFKCSSGLKVPPASARS